MPDQFFDYIYLTGLMVASGIRSVYGRRHKRTPIVARRKEPHLVWLFMILWGVSQIIPFFYVFSGWLEFADYGLPVWLKSIGAVIFIFGIWFIFRSHADLGRNWRPYMEIVEEHTLITGGVYQYIRHPMYAAHIFYSLGQGLLLGNWLAGWLALVCFIPVYYLRVPGEEKMLMEQFGDEYRSYKTRTGGILPRFSSRNES